MGRRRHSPAGRRSGRTVLRLESLEDRCVPANLYVTSSADNVNQAGTLRYELAHAKAGDSIVIKVSSITLTQGELVVNQKDLSIQSYDLNTPVTISGGNHSRVFDFAADAFLTSLDITDGNGLAGNASSRDAYRDGQGGAILNEAKLFVAKCTFTHNRAQLGGAIFNLGYNGNLTLGSCTLSANSAQDGGGLYNYYADAQLWYCTLSGNSAARDGGALYNRGVSMTVWGWDASPGGTLEVSGSKFYSNVASGDGGAICNWVSNLTISGGDFEHNKAHFGGAIINMYGTAAISLDATLLGNLAQPIAPGIGGAGGAIDNFGGAFQVRNCEFQYNGAVYGGGICNSRGTVTVTGSTLDSNWASSAGDNVYNGATMTIAGCHLIDWSSTSYSVDAPTGTLHVGGSTFQGQWKIKGPWINDGNNKM
jgi:hypothetical protein